MASKSHVSKHVGSPAASAPYRHQKRSSSQRPPVRKHATERLNQRFGRLSRQRERRRANGPRERESVKPQHQKNDVGERGDIRTDEKELLLSVATEVMGRHESVVSQKLQEEQQYERMTAQRKEKRKKRQGLTLEDVKARLIEEQKERRRSRREQAKKRRRQSESNVEESTALRIIPKKVRKMVTFQVEDQAS